MHLLCSYALKKIVFWLSARTCWKRPKRISFIALWMINGSCPSVYKALKLMKSFILTHSYWINYSFFQDWWNSTSFANYYRTWNVVVHDWLYYYGYRDFLWVSRVAVYDIKSDCSQSSMSQDEVLNSVQTFSLFCIWFLQLSQRRFRTAAMLSVFIVSAVVHEYALAMGFGFFYPVMFCLFAVFGGERWPNYSRNNLSNRININYGDYSCLHHYCC